MRGKLVLAMTLLVAVALAGVAVAGETHEKASIEGTMVCALCTLKAEGLKSCQNVVQVKGDEGDTMHYYLVKNKVAEDFGHVCKGTKDVKVTGMVSEKEGKTWIEADSIQDMSKS